MRGHKPIEAMRRKGITPPVVWVSDIDGIEVDHWVRNGTDPEVFIGADDDVPRLDLRFAKGLRVEVHTFAEHRTADLVDAFVAAGADRVLGCVFELQKHGAECVAMTDTAGEAVWAKEIA